MLTGLTAIVFLRLLNKSVSATLPEIGYQYKMAIGSVFHQSFKMVTMIGALICRRKRKGSSAPKKRIWKCGNCTWRIMEPQEIDLGPDHGPIHCFWTKEGLVSLITQSFLCFPHLQKFYSAVLCSLTCSIGSLTSHSHCKELPCAEVLNVRNCDGGVLHTPEPLHQGKETTFFFSVKIYICTVNCCNLNKVRQLFTLLDTGY